MPDILTKEGFVSFFNEVRDFVESKHSSDYYRLMPVSVSFKEISGDNYYSIPWQDHAPPTEISIRDNTIIFEYHYGNTPYTAYGLFLKTSLIESEDVLLFLCYDHFSFDRYLQDCLFYNNSFKFIPYTIGLIEFFSLFKLIENKYGPVKFDSSAVYPYYMARSKCKKQPIYYKRDPEDLLKECKENHMYIYESTLEKPFIIKLNMFSSLMQRDSIDEELLNSITSLLITSIIDISSNRNTMLSQSISSVSSFTSSGILANKFVLEELKDEVIKSDYKAALTEDSYVSELKVWDKDGPGTARIRVYLSNHYTTPIEEIENQKPSDLVDYYFLATHDSTSEFLNRMYSLMSYHLGLGAYDASN